VNNIIVTGLDVLVARKERQRIPKELEYLPPKYKLYLEYFEQEKNNYPFEPGKVYLESKPFHYRIGWDNMHKISVLTEEGDKVEGMLSMSAHLENDKIDPDWEESGYKFIGNTYAYEILLGISGDNIVDGIYLENRSDRDLVHYVATDIFEFFQKIKLEPGKRTLRKLELKPEQLYRNFGEDFWRVRQK